MIDVFIALITFFVLSSTKMQSEVVYTCGMHIMHIVNLIRVNNVNHLISRTFLSAGDELRLVINH